uniref:Cilia and flagella associated protein 92 (putative) n=1 Tax=Strix occidentalis caurina TaxID=311401 RepID=A0A8D0FIX0_STROC
MTEQTQNSKAVEEEDVEEDDKEEVTDLSTICSESTFETENLEVLGSGGHLTPEGESSRLPPSEKSSVELGGSHTVTCTLTVSLAVPALPTVDESGSTPRMQCCYHIEYFLLPDDLVPRKLDLVLFGVVAKLFTESNSEAITPWFENDKMWVSWNHSVDIDVTNEYVIKLRDHKIILKIWDTKNKVSSKVRHSKPTIASSLEGDAEDVGKSNANRHVLKHVEIVTAPIDKLLLRLFDIHIRGSGPKRTMDATIAKGCGIASLQLAVMPLLSGEKSVISRLAENNPKVLDAYMTFSVETPLLSERQRHELNPLTIRINSATCLPNTPVPIDVLQRLCVPTYCKYKFHSFPPHRTHGQVHGTHVYFKDVNVILTGTMKPGELQRCLRGPPLEIEVHDRDRNTKNNTKKPCLFEEDEPDEKVGKVSFPPCKSTICSSSTKNKAWHPHGVAKVSLTELLLGKKYLTISAPIHSCSAPNTATFSEEDKKKKITESVNSSSLLPMGHYLESDSLLKVRVEIAVPLGLHAEIAEVTSCLYGCIIYIFDYNNSPLLHDLVEEISEINAKALQLVCYPVHLITMALAALKLKTTLEKVSELDIVTGFHLLDGATHLFVLEGLKDKAIKRLWDRHFERTYRHEDGQLEILYNSQLSFPERLYTDLEAIFYHFCLCQPLCTVTKQPLLYIRGMVPRACFQALSRYDSYLCHSKRLRDVIHGDLLPSAEMISVLSHEYGVPLTDEDLFTRKPPLLSFSSDDCTVPGKVSRVKQAVYSSSEVYVQQKKEIADKMSFERNHIEVSRKMKKPKFEVFRISPIDGKSVFNYSSQRLNSAELAKQHLRQEMAKEPKNRFTYCHEYLSATFDPVDVAAACKELFAKSKSMWLSPDGFVFPGFKSSIESNLHPQMPDKKWQENVLHANMEPVLSRDRWSWDKRHIDFDLYKKPPELFMTAAPQTGNGSGKIN